MIDDVLDSIVDWIKDVCVGFIESAISGALSSVDDAVNIVGGEVSKTPETWNATVFNMMKGISDNVVMPIATMLFAFLVVYDFLQLLMDKNNMHDIDVQTVVFFIARTAIGLYILSGTMTIVTGLFRVGAWLAEESVTYITGQSLDAVFPANLDVLAGLEMWDLLLLVMLCGLMNIVTIAIVICIYIVLYGRMIECYMYITASTIPMTTIVLSRDNEIGKNFVKSIFALALQGFLIIVCVAIYYAMVMSLVGTLDFEIAIDVPPPIGPLYKMDTVMPTMRNAIIQVIVMGVVLCFTLFKTSTISKSILSAH